VNFNNSMYHLYFVEYSTTESTTYICSHLYIRISIKFLETLKCRITTFVISIRPAQPFALFFFVVLFWGSLVNIRYPSTSHYCKLPTAHSQFLADCFGFNFGCYLTLFRFLCPNEFYLACTRFVVKRL